MTEEGLATYYAKQVANERLQQGQQVFAQASLAALERITPLHRLRRTLDVGAGYGFLLSYLQARHGIRGIGVEPSVVESDYGRSQLGVDIRPVLLPEAALAQAAFDLVCSFEVLEHTVDPVSFVAELSDYVAPGGYLVIGTDNFESAVVRALGPGFPKWIPHTHVSHFAPATLAKLMQGLDGFTIRGYVSYTPWEFQARRMLTPVRRTLTAPEAYDLASELAREVSRAFKLYRLRRAVTGAWFKCTSARDLSGEMMYIALQKANT